MITARAPNWLGRFLAAAWLTIAAAVLVSGLEYYQADAATRAYSDAHELYGPTGRVGQSLGYLGALSVVVGVASYVLRKRWRRLQNVGRLSDWLQVHIFLCTLGPFLVLMHTSFKFRGIAAISFWSMMAAVASGAVGRYLYAHIPRTLHGGLRTLDALQAEASELRAAGDASPAVRRAFDNVLMRPPAPPRTLAHALWLALRHDLGRRSSAGQLERALRATELPEADRRALTALLRTRQRLELQVILLPSFQRLFHYWHVLHLPVAIIMFLTLALHVAVAFAFGYGWPF